MSGAQDFTALGNLAPAFAPGAWRYQADASGSLAALATTIDVRCDRATRRVRITSGEPRLPLTIITDTSSRIIAADGWVAARDPLLAAIAFSRGRFYLRRGGGALLAIPTSPEAARSIEDCQN